MLVLLHTLSSLYGKSETKIWILLQAYHHNPVHIYSEVNIFNGAYSQVNVQF